MLAILSETPEEVIRGLKSYFLIRENYYILHDADHIDSLFYEWCDEFEGHEAKIATRSGVLHKAMFELPFIVISSDKEAIDDVRNSCFCGFLNEVTDVDSASEMMITLGFLPLDESIILSYRDKHIDSTLDPKHQVIQFFKQLGYLKEDLTPSNRLIQSLENDETRRYADLIMILVTNNPNGTFSSDERYIDFLFEVFKYIDINIHHALIPHSPSSDSDSSDDDPQPPFKELCEFDDSKAGERVTIH